MQIKQILSARNPAISFEVFPPRRDAPAAPVREAVERLCRIRPAFMSVTYGAAGMANTNTLAIARYVQQCGVSALAHLTCIGSSRDAVRGYLGELRSAGVENVLALRGDRPADAPVDAPAGDFVHAADLVREIKAFGGFCIGAACYPECHPECAHIEDDVAHLREKVDAGVDFLTTQMFFDNNVYFRYLSRLRQAGITVPVVAGVMPVTNGRQIERICRLSGTNLPPRFRSIVDRYGDNPASMLDAGIAYATEQIVDLFANGAQAVHIYTMNKSVIGERILANLGSIVNP